MEPIKKAAETLKKHLHGLLSYFQHHICQLWGKGKFGWLSPLRCDSNAATEAFNSSIQAIKSAARGFRSFENYRIRILFFLGRINLHPI